MFTGLVETIATLEAIEPRGDAQYLKIAVDGSDYLDGAEIGESISVAGCCLTVTELWPQAFAAIAVEETMRRTALRRKMAGSRLNLERALKASARLGGHIVQGHVDGVATVSSAREEGEGWWVSFEPPLELMRYIVEKGSICIDGISLTVANVAYNRFSVALIPHTREVTTAGEWQPGAEVNIEVDIVAKYIERLTQWHHPAAADILPGAAP